jgi:hypothetical protein
MGKAADNEKRKLQATFYNNLAVGVSLGGALLPALAFYQGWPEFYVWNEAWEKGEADVSALAVWQFFILFGLIGIALALVIGWRRLAQHFAQQIED